MNVARRVFEFLKLSSQAHARWDYEVSMSILKNRKKMLILLVALLPILVIMFAEAGDMLGSKTAYADGNPRAGVSTGLAVPFPFFAESA